MPNEVTADEWDDLAARAARVRGAAYAPYSRFKVGAALLATDGRVFEGVNIENSSYGLTVCAERVAATTAITAGAKGFVAIVIATESPAWPCGACRQFLFEWGGDLLVATLDEAGAIDDTKPLAELLPNGFRL